MNRLGRDCPTRRCGPSRRAQTASAALRRVEDVGLELRFIWNAELAHSQVYRDVQELLAVAKAKREELEARGWKA